MGKFFTRIFCGAHSQGSAGRPGQWPGRKGFASEAGKFTFRVWRFRERMTDSWRCRMVDTASSRSDQGIMGPAQRFMPTSRATARRYISR